MKKDKILKIILMAMILFSLISAVKAYPPLPTEFYGTIIYYNEKAPINYYLTAKDQSNTSCGLFLVKNTGYFGVLSCKGDINDTLSDEGADYGEQIKFTFRNEEADIKGDATYEFGKYKEIILIIPKIVCGDMFCQKTYETCLLCPSDCGQCLTPNQTTPPNQTNATPPTGGGGGGGGGGGAGGGGGGGGGGGLGDIQNILINASQLNNTPAACKEEWNCTDWSECFPNETQIRACLDINGCNTTKNIPPEIQECIYFGNCFDGIRNGKERGIDCGGPCRPCPGYEGEPNCFDGLKNCHDGECEEGVDCGGVCENECEKPKKIESPIKICNKPTDLFRLDFLLLYALILVFIIIYVTIEKEREKRIKKDARLKDVEKARKYLSIEKNIMLFLIFVILMLAFIIIYYMFFFCSKDFYEFLKFVIPAVLIIPLLAFFIMKTFEYDEKTRKEKLERFLNTHHEHIKKLMMLQNDYLKELEVEISNDVYQLSAKDEFRESLEKYPELKTVYRDMIVLYDKYKEQKTALGIEKALCDSIKSLEDNENFKKLGEKHPKIKVVYDKLATLYKAYEEKQELYKELKEEDKKEPEDKDKKKDK